MADNTMKWGKATAASRYGAKSDGSLNNNSKDNNLQPPQCPQDKHGAGYDNDASGWVRGMPSAESKPGFDKHKAGR